MRDEQRNLYLKKLVDYALEGRSFELRMFKENGKHFLGINIRRNGFRSPWGTGLITLCKWPTSKEEWEAFDWTGLLNGEIGFEEAVRLIEENFK